MQIRTEIGMKRLLDLWKDQPSAILSFNEIKMGLDWTSDKTARQIGKAIDEGYLEKTEREGKRGYLNRMVDYNGYFDGFERLAEIDSHCRKTGKVQNVDHPLRMFTPIHVVEYGVPREEELTPLESELLFTIRARLAHAFEDFANLSEGIEWRQEIEHFKKLPESVRNPLFARDDEKDKDMPPISIRAAGELYGDALWEHIFERIIGDIRRALIQGTLDATGPVELFQAYRPLMDATSQAAEMIRQGKASRYDDPDSEVADKILNLRMKRDPKRFNPLSHDSPDIAVVVTHSPRTIGEYSYQIGTIVGDELAYWSDDKPMFATILEKGKSKWDDRVQDPTGTRLRREALAYGLVTNIANMRWHYKQLISETDRKFMLKDSKLREVLTEEEVLKVVTEVERVTRRARKFVALIAKGAPPSKLLRDPEWFSDEEFTRYSFLDQAIPPAYHFPKGTDPSKVKLPRVDDLIEELEKKFPRWKLRGTKGKVARARKPGT